MSEQPSNIHRWLCVAAILAGVFLRFHRLGESLWYDEAVSVRTAQTALAELPQELSRGEDSNPPLFPLLLKAWMGAFGDSDSAIHALTACIGVLAVLSAGLAGFLLGGARVGLTAAALMSLHPWGVVYAQEARAYELLVLVSLWSCYFLAVALRRGGRDYWAAFSVATTVNLYTHNYAVFLLLSQCAWIAFAARSRREVLRPALIAIALALLAYAPWTLFALRQTRALPEISALGWRDLVYTFYSEAGLWVMAGPMVCHWPPGLLAPLLFVDLGLGAWAFSRFKRQDPELALGLLAVVVLAAAVPMLASLVRPIYTTGRHNVITLPALCLLAAFSIEALSAKAWRLALLVFILGTSAFPLAGYFSLPKSYERQIAEFIKTSDQPGYRLLVYPEYRRVTLGHYYAKALRAEEGVEVGSANDLPAGLIVVAEYPRVLGPAQALMMERYYRLERKESFGLSTAGLWVLKPGARKALIK